MRTRTVVGTAAVAAMALLASACSGGSEGASTATTSTVPPGAPAEVAAATGDWVLPGHDYDNSRAAVSTIDAANVRSLTKAWSHEVSGSLSTVPLIVGDTVYLQDGSGRISALDRATGDPAVGERGVRPQHRAVRCRRGRRPGVRHARLEGGGRPRRRQRA